MAAFYLTFKGSIINFTSIWVKLTKFTLSVMSQITIAIK